LISYVTEDRDWADWMTWVLEEHGHEVTTQELDAQLSREDVVELEESFTVADRTLLVMSDHLLKTNFNQLLLAPMLRKASASGRSLLPIRIDECQPGEPLASLQVLDLLDQTEAEAEQKLVEALSGTGGQVLTVGGRVLTIGGQALTIGDDLSDAVEVGEGGLKLRRRRHVVRGFLEKLTDDLELMMMQIPEGSFLMGSPDDEPERSDDEGPQHRVTVPEFFMGKYPVTQAQWRFVAELLQVEQELNPTPSQFEGELNPVESVSWYDVAEFCRRLSQLTGRVYRLPTEAEWEYACRVNTLTPFHFGETITTDLANYRGTDNEERGWSGSYGRGPKGIYREKTTPVNHFDLANEFGLCDMHGNVWEWCEDHWHENYEDAPTDGNAWLTENEDAERVFRGGSWLVNPGNCRSACRNYTSPGGRDGSLGFRVVCSAPRT